MAKSSKPNILVTWGDDIGISNLSCYSHGLMGYKTPNIDRLAKEGTMFTDSYGWKGQTDAALTGTLGLPQKTMDMAGGAKVYHYDFDGSKCVGDFQVDSKQIVQDVQMTGSDLARCPRKLPGRRKLLGTGITRPHVQDRVPEGAAAVAAGTL